MWYRRENLPVLVLPGVMLLDGDERAVPKLTLGNLLSTSHAFGVRASGARSLGELCKVGMSESGTSL